MVTQFSQAFRQIRSRPLQSTLIVLAITLGVSIITAVAAYIRSDQERIDRVKAALEFRQIIISDKSIDFASAFERTTSRPQKVEASLEPITFNKEDLERIKAESPTVDYAYVAPPEYRTTFVLLENGSDAGIAPVTQDYFDAAQLEIASGEAFSQDDFINSRQVMIVTPRGAERMGLVGDPVGQTFSASTLANRFTIIGVLTEPDNLIDYDAIIPEGASLLEGEAEPTSTLFFAVDDADKLSKAQGEIETFVSKTWGSDVLVYAKSLTSLNQTFRLTTLFTALFATLGLVIASINVMNLFTARVLRRQRELAIMRSLGASQNNIGFLMISEAICLGVAGGLLGIVGGWAFTHAINLYIQGVSQGTWSPLTFSTLGACVGFAFALLLSIMFSLYPAFFASRLRISEALKES